MKQTYVKYLMVATFAGGFLFTSCRTARETTAQYEVTKVEGSMITIDSVWDTIPNAKAAEILKPYNEKVDAMMYEVIGTSEMIMDKGFATAQATQVIDMPTLLKAVELYNKWYFQESKGLTAESLKQYQLINSSIISAMIDVIPKYVEKDKQDKMIAEMNDRAAKIIDNAGATREGKELLKQLEKEGLSL